MANADNNPGRPQFPKNPDLYPDQNTEYGAGLVEELCSVAQVIKGSRLKPEERAKIYDTEKLILLDIIKFQKEYGNLPPGIDI